MRIRYLLTYNKKIIHRWFLVPRMVKCKKFHVALWLTSYVCGSQKSFSASNNLQTQKRNTKLNINSVTSSFEKNLKTKITKANKENTQIIWHYTTSMYINFISCCKFSYLPSSEKIAGYRDNSWKIERSPKYYSFAIPQ